LGRTVDQEVGGSNPPEINNLRPPLASQARRFPKLLVGKRTGILAIPSRPSPAYTHLMAWEPLPRAADSDEAKPLPPPDRG
jgi:hypothetical protein